MNITAQSQKHYQEECNHGILQYKRAAIFRDRFFRCQSWIESSVGEGQNVVPME